MDTNTDYSTLKITLNCSNGYWLRIRKSVTYNLSLSPLECVCVCVCVCHTSSRCPVDSCPTTAEHDWFWHSVRFTSIHSDYLHIFETTYSKPLPSQSLPSPHGNLYLQLSMKQPMVSPAISRPQH